MFRVLSNIRAHIPTTGQLKSDWPCRRLSSFPCAIPKRHTACSNSGALGTLPVPHLPLPHTCRVGISLQIITSLTLIICCSLSCACEDGLLQQFLNMCKRFTVRGGSVSIGTTILPGRWCASVPFRFPLLAFAFGLNIGKRIQGSPVRCRLRLL